MLKCFEEFKTLAFQKIDAEMKMLDQIVEEAEIMVAEEVVNEQP